MAGNPDDILTAAEVAVLKGVEVQTVTQACRPPGRLPARKAGGTWLIRRADAEAWTPRPSRKKKSDESG